MYEDQWVDGARIMHLLFSFLACLLVYSLICLTSREWPMKTWRWLAACALACSAGFFTHWALDVLVRVP